jgi:predicted dehydrogenase
MNRREFLLKTGATLAVAGLSQSNVFSAEQAAKPAKKKKLAMIGTSGRGITMWGKKVLEQFPGEVEFVGLSDPNPGRMEFAAKYMGTSCPLFTDFDAMMSQTKPDTLIVTTVDAYHDQYIVKGMEMGSDIITEKPMTIDEVKCQSILDAQRRTKKNCVVTFNYRYSPQREKMKELLMGKAIGDVVSVDFNWYLDTYHGADYFRRWHAFRNKSGSLLCHKSTHHFDLLNWWLDSEPSEVFAYGGLEFYGKNNAFRSTHCRACNYKDKCQFYWNIEKSEFLPNPTIAKQFILDLYVANEKYDGYHRDGCVFRNEIDIFDKMAVQIKYANKVQVSYSLTTYSPYEGYRIAFNGTKGRLEAWIHERQPWPMEKFDEIRLTKNFGDTQLIQIPLIEHEHGGGDPRLRDRIFKNPNGPDPYKQAAGIRDGAMSVLIGIAARNSIDTGKPVKIADLTDLKPEPQRPVA